MSWIDQFLTAIGYVQDAGTPLIQRPTINFVLPPGGSVVDDPTTKVTTVTVPTAAASTQISARLVATSSILLTGTPTIDGVTPTPGDIVLAAGQTGGAENGLWIVASGAWSRTTDSIVPGMVVFIQAGTTYTGSAFTLVTAAPITVGSTPLHFVLVAPSINVQIFGAKGDGSTDDTAAFAAATSAAGTTGHPIFVPPGTYMLTAWTLGTAGLSVNGAGRSSTTIKLSASAARVAHVSAADVTLTGLTIDGNANVTAGNGAIDTTSAAQRVGLYDVQLKSVPVGLALAAGAGVQGENVQIEAVTTAGIQVTDYADLSWLKGIYNTSPCAAPLIEFVSPSTVSHQPFVFEIGSWSVSSGDAGLLTANQPVFFTRIDFDAYIAIVAGGVERAGASECSFTQSGAQANGPFYDSGGSPGTLTYPVTDDNNYKAA